MIDSPAPTGRKIPDSFKTICDPELLRPLCTFGFFPEWTLCIDRLTGMEHLWELRFQLTPRDARWWGHMVQFSTFRGGVKIDTLASNSSTSFSIPTMEKADLCLEISQSQLSNGTISIDRLRSFASKLQWPPTMAWKEHVLLSITPTTDWLWITETSSWYESSISLNLCWSHLVRNVTHYTDTWCLWSRSRSTRAKTLETTSFMREHSFHFRVYSQDSSCKHLHL